MQNQDLRCYLDENLIKYEDLCVFVVKMLEKIHFESENIVIKESQLNQISLNRIFWNKLKDFLKHLMAIFNMNESEIK